MAILIYLNRKSRKCCDSRYLTEKYLKRINQSIKMGICRIKMNQTDGIFTQHQGLWLFAINMKESTGHNVNNEWALAKNRGAQEHIDNPYKSAIMIDLNSWNQTDLGRGVKLNSASWIWLSKWRFPNSLTVTLIFQKLETGTYSIEMLLLADKADLVELRRGV